MIEFRMDKFLVGIKALVYNEQEEFLILKRTETAPSNPNTWDLPGGLLDYEETPKEAIQREIQEEASLKVINIQLHSETSFLRKGEPTVVLFYKCLANNDQVTISEEHSEYKWVSLEDALKHKLQPWIKDHLEKF